MALIVLCPAGSEVAGKMRSEYRTVNGPPFAIGAEARCFGLGEEPVSWTWQEFLDLPRVEVTSDIHCVTRWSRFDNRLLGPGD